MAQFNPSALTPREAHIFKRQQNLVQVCPNKCEGALIPSGIPDPRVLPPRNAQARCLCCLTYWEVTPEGKIINVKVVEQKDATPLDNL